MTSAPTALGDIVVVDACGDMTSGIFGEMMMTWAPPQFVTMARAQT
jgi:regulator of RNase E activity RraA